MTNLREPLALLREQVASLLAEIDAATPPVVPLSVRPHTGEIDLRFWYEDKTLSVHTCAGLENDSVFVSGRYPGIENWPDWTALSPGDARRLAYALLAAANDATSDLTHASTTRLARPRRRRGPASAS